MPPKDSVEVYGCVHDANTYYCRTLLEKIEKTGLATVNFTLLLEVEYRYRIEDLRRTHGELRTHLLPHLVLRNGIPVGGIEELISLASSEYGVESANVANTVMFQRYVRENTLKRLTENDKQVVYLQFASVDPKRPTNIEDLGIIHIELLNNFCPDACNSFAALCQGIAPSGNDEKVVGYVDSKVHRILRDGFFQAGDLIDGTGGHVVGGDVADESFAVDFGATVGGVVGFAALGAHQNRSQFFITLAPCAWMNAKFVGFGRVVQGFETLRRINEQSTSNQVPTMTIKIISCGLSAELLDNSSRK